jgi:endo-1,4-beta-xylanase
MTKQGKLLSNGLLVLGAAAFLCVAQPSQAGDVQGHDHGYWYECWWTTGSASISFPSAGTYAGNFQANWSNVGDTTIGKGWQPGQTRTCGYNCGYINNFQNFGMYGWANYPNVEWYMTDMGSRGGSFKGTLNSDGGTYNVYLASQGGGAQYNDARTVWQSTGQNHTITMANHINFWSSHGMPLHSWSDGWTYAKLNVEAWGNQSGSCNATVW